MSEKIMGVAGLWKLVRDFLPNDPAQYNIDSLKLYLKSSHPNCPIYIDLLGAFYVPVKKLVMRRDFVALANILKSILPPNSVVVIDGESPTEKSETTEKRNEAREKALQSMQRVIEKAKTSKASKLSANQRRIFAKSQFIAYNITTDDKKRLQNAIKKAGLPCVIAKCWLTCLLARNKVPTSLSQKTQIYYVIRVLQFKSFQKDYQEK